MFETLKKQWHILTMFVAMITMIVTGVVWAGEFVEKMGMMEQIQMKQAQNEEKLINLTLKLWQIDPEQRHKWSILPVAPKIGKAGDTITSEWVALIDDSLLIRYKFTRDSVTTSLAVDTLREQNTP